MDIMNTMKEKMQNIIFTIKIIYLPKTIYKNMYKKCPGYTRVIFLTYIFERPLT